MLRRYFQDLSLHNGMSIMENFYFYGYIFGLEDHVIQTRAQELISFLDLPMGHRLLSELRYRDSVFS